MYELGQSHKELVKTLSTEARLFIQQRLPGPYQVGAFIGGAAIAKALAGIRSRVLRWSLDLESSGVVGEDLEFSDDERIKAQAAQTTIHIGSINSVVGGIGHVEDLVNTATTVNIGSFIERAQRTLNNVRQIVDQDDYSDKADLLAAVVETQRLLDVEVPDESRLRALFRKLGAAAVTLSSFAAQALITIEIGKLLTSK